MKKFFFHQKNWNTRLQVEPIEVIQHAQCAFMHAYVQFAWLRTHYKNASDYYYDDDHMYIYYSGTTAPYTRFGFHSVPVCVRVCFEQIRNAESIRIIMCVSNLDSASHRHRVNHSASKWYKVQTVSVERHNLIDHCWIDLESHSSGSICITSFTKLKAQWADWSYCHWNGTPKCREISICSKIK